MGPAFWFMAFGHEFVTSTAEYEGREELDFGFDPLGLKPDDPVAFRELQQGTQQRPPGNGRRCRHHSTGAGYGRRHFHSTKVNAANRRSCVREKAFPINSRMNAANPAEN